MALVQALLVRSLVAMFWERPLPRAAGALGHRGCTRTSCCPQGATADIGEVVADLRAHGIAFEDAWLDPFTEFRFPRIGVTLDRRRRTAIELELRQADRAVARARRGGHRRRHRALRRLLGRADPGDGRAGSTPQRHLVTCQGVPVPLTADRPRRRALRRRPLPRLAALVGAAPVASRCTRRCAFDVVDTAPGVSLGGATYHVVHPGGRSYDHPPVNANEAEARRASRFEPHGHTAGRLDVAAMREAGRRAREPDYPRTLDLRRVPDRRDTLSAMTVLRDYAAALAQPTSWSATPARATTRWSAPTARCGRRGRAWPRSPSDHRRRPAAGSTARSARCSPTTASPTRDPARGRGPGSSTRCRCVIDAASWAPLEVGLAQRAELLNAILVDLYGEQRLLADGVIPPAVVLRPRRLHPGRRPARRRSTRGRWCWPRPTSAATPTGEWRVLADRAQAPSGLGYAMENRRVHLAGAARALPRGRAAPDGAVLLGAPLRAAPVRARATWPTRGSSCSRRARTPRRRTTRPSSPSAWASRSCRAATSWCATAGCWMQRRLRGRLERVDVILRRVDAAWSDPLELRGDSQLGVAGLAEAVRRGRVRIVNGLGAGVLENPGAAALPAGRLRGAARRAAAAAVGADLVVRRPRRRSTHVLDRLDRLASCAPIDGPRRRSPARAGASCATGSSPRRTASSARSGCRCRRRRPGATAAGSAAWRTPARSRCGRSRCATGRRTARWSAGSPTSSTTATARAAASKDVWVLKDVAERPRPGAGRRAADDQRPVGASVLVPRVARGHVLVGRYAERAEDLLRLVLAAHALRRGLPDPAAHRRAAPASRC